MRLRRPWPGAAPPLGVFAFNQQDAANLGQTRAFVMDLRRLAALPVTPVWFPGLDQPEKGVRPAIVERLGPAWPGGRR